MLKVSGVDLLDKTPIYDIEALSALRRAHPQASGGFASDPNEGVSSSIAMTRFWSDWAMTQRRCLPPWPVIRVRPTTHDPESVLTGCARILDRVFSVDGDTLTVHSVGDGHIGQVHLFI